MQQKQLVLIGGGHAHMVTLANLCYFTDKGCRVTVIQPSDYHYYSGMGPGMLGGTYLPDHIRFHTRRAVESRGGIFIRDKAWSIDPVQQQVVLEHSDEVISYDVLSCNAGSFVPVAKALRGENIFTAKPIEGLLHAQQEIIRQGKKRSLEIALIGGGPSSVEIAGNIRQLADRCPIHLPTIRIFAGSRLMNHQNKRIGQLVHQILEQQGIKIVEGSYVREIKQGQVVLENGKHYGADLIFPASGVKPSPIFTRSGLPIGPDGGLLVNQYLQSTAYPNIFGGGDCITFQPQPLKKLGVYAVRENPVLYQNLSAALFGGNLQSFTPGSPSLLIYNLGNGQGVLCKGPLIFSGRLAFTIKDFIDRKFIRTFTTD